MIVMATFHAIIMFLRHKEVPNPFDPAISSFRYFIRNNILGYCERPEELAILISRSLLRICRIYLSNINLAFAKNDTRLELLSLFHSLFATWRSRARPARDGCQVHCGTVLGDAFSTWRQICPPKQSHNAHSQPSRHGLARNLNVANLIARILNFYHMKHSQSLALEQ